MMNIALNSIEISNLTKIYEPGGAGKRQAEPVVANDDISLTIKRGEIFGLLGPNGAGKTTLVNQLLGLTYPTDGTITVEGIDVIRQPHRVKSISSYLPQRLMAFDYVQVIQALTFAGQLKGLSKVEARKQADQLITALDLTEVAHKYFNTLSGGMRRVVGLALALMGRPKLLVLDEPTNELDPVRRRRVWQIIREINQQRGITCVLVTHNVLEAETVLDQVAILSQGQVVASGTPGELKQQISTEALLDLSLKKSMAEAEIKSLAEGLENKLNYLLQASGVSSPIRLGFPPNNFAAIRIYLPFERSGEVINYLLGELGTGIIDDFKLSHTSLEDVYMHFVQAKDGQIMGELEANTGELNLAN